MTFRALYLALLFGFAPFSAAFAQRVCKKGIPCGNACIAANRVCRTKPAKALSADTTLPDTLPPVATPVTAPVARPTPVVPDSSAAKAAKGLDSLAPALARGGQTKVWVNTKSRVYHCPGSKYYDNSGSGMFSTEQAAVAAGHRAAYGRRCGT
jgi:hypothetical protein